MSNSQEIRGALSQKLLGKCIGWLCRIWGWTYRLEVNDDAGVMDKKRQKPVVFLLWHNRLFAAIPLWKKTCGHFPLVALMSASKDGTILEAAVRTVGADVARGSSSRRGAAALVYLRRALRQNKDAYITPDGPRGPLYELKEGALKLAQAEQASVVTIRINMKSYWQLKSWDQFRIPKPFSKIQLNYDSPIQIRSELSPEEFEATRLEIEQQMSRNKT